MPGMTSASPAHCQPRNLPKPCRTVVCGLPLAGPLGAAAAACAALRCLESLLAREAAAVPLPGHITALALRVPAQLFAEWVPPRCMPQWQ